MRFFTAGGRSFYSSGKLIKVCGLVNSWYESIENPEELIKALKTVDGIQHIFTFFQRVPHIIPQYNYYMEEYSVAVIRLESFEEWWSNQVKKNTRQAIKSSIKKGVEVKPVQFNDDYIRGICTIYNETPVRSGKIFPHFKDSFEKAKSENSTFLDRSVFLGAYWQNELIGFAKLVFEKEFVDILQLLGKMAHRDKRVTNALMAEIVKICCGQNSSYIVYGDYNTSGLGDFKRHNGFVRMGLPKYYVPLNNIGRVALHLKMHRRISEWVPEKIKPFFRDVRKKWYKDIEKN